MSAKPYLFLDVDGVLNAPYPAWPSTLRVPIVDHPKLPQGVVLTLSYSPEMVAAIKDLEVELVWLTTWEDSAQTHLVPLINALGGNIYLSSAGHVKLSDYTGLWKYSALREFVEAHPRPFIWVYDDAISSRAERDLVTLDVAHLLVRPYPKQGITPNHVALIKEFLCSLLP